GIPLALAAFVSGLAITESREATEARERLLPFRDVFALLFFVAIGALIDPPTLLRGSACLILILGLLLVTKVMPTYLFATFARLLNRRAAHGALSELGRVRVGRAGDARAHVDAVKHERSRALADRLQVHSELLEPDGRIASAGLDQQHAAGRHAGEEPVGGGD